MCITTCLVLKVDIIYAINIWGWNLMYNVQIAGKQLFIVSRLKKLGMVFCGKFLWKNRQKRLNGLLKF